MLTGAIFAIGTAGGVSAGRAGDHSFELLYSFSEGADGYQPQAGLLLDKAGNLYGTTSLGGNVDGTVFELTPGGTETVLYAFQNNGKDGIIPFAGVISDKAGNRYGTTAFGGTQGVGAVFKLAPDGTETVLHSFTGGSDGGQPYSGLLRGKGGDLYGTTAGSDGSHGTVFKLAPNGKEKVLYSFTGGNDGSVPASGLIADKAGNLYGTTLEGGANSAGTVFNLAPDGTESVIYAFTGGNDGGAPHGSLIADAAGNLYGTTTSGGAACCGVVFKVTPEGKEKTLHSFTDKNDGANPEDALIAGKAGNFYGTTNGGGAYGFGTVFEIAKDGTFKVLHAFSSGADTDNSNSGLVMDKAGNLYGTTEYGGADGYGTVYKLRK